jgi:hypothetical protein
MAKRTKRPNRSVQREAFRAASRNLTTTPYGRAFLEIVRQIPADKRKDVPKILRKYEIAPGQLFIPASHRAYWLSDDAQQRLGPWIDAIEQIDRHGKKGPLMALLRSQLGEVGKYLADLIDRYELVPPKHRPRTPAYDRSKAEAKLGLAIETVRIYCKSMPVKEAIAKAAEEFSLEENTLANAYQGRRGSSRRIKKRRS